MKWIQKKQEGVPNKRDSIMERIAKIRGIQDPERFLNPTKDELHDPYLLKNIEEAAGRIAQAIDERQRIVVSYDPDCDGITSATILIRYLKNYTPHVDFIYGERGDGHGIASMIAIQKPEDTERHELNSENIRKVQEADLVILVDSSSNDTEACRLIQYWGTEVIVLDHHAIEEPNPYCLLVNPQQAGCAYPNKHLSGAGVVFKTIQVVEDLMEGDVDPFQYIDLVAVGMYADVMRVDVLENRYLIMEGMRNMKNTGLVRILKSGKQNLFRINSASIGFSISPMINGVARMDQLKLAIDLLLEDDDKVCQKIQRQMKKINEERKERQRTITAQYETKIDPSKKVLIVVDEQTSKGFNGIVAQQLAVRFKRPVIVARQHKGKISGSFRSYANFPLKGFLKGFGDIEAVGHEPAGGIVLNEELLPDLEAYIEEHMPAMLDMEPTVEYDIEIDVRDVGEYISTIEQFNLLVGNGFPKITIRVNGIGVDEVAIIGATRETCKIKTFDHLELIKFRVGEDYASDLGCFDIISAVGQLQINEFYNFQTKKKTVTPQIILDDYRIH